HGRGNVMLDLGRILLHGAVLSAIGSLLIMSAVYLNPRFVRKDLPRDIQDATPPLTRKERLQASAFAIPFFALCIGIPLVSALTLQSPGNGHVPFFTLFIHIFGVILVFNLVDLFILDWLIYCRITPRFVVIPGTEGFAGYKDFGHQFRAHIRGTILMVVLSFLLAGIVALLR
ncbi:MAG: hypothetical protein JSW71_07400, partial [Gemmatimonadota bacterium]